MCFDCSVEGAGCGRQESCVQEKLFDGMPSALGEFGKVCAVILPGTMALCSCKNIRPQAEAQRSSLEEPAGHISRGWSMAVWWRGRKSLCVCADPVGSSLQAPRFVVCVQEWALEPTDSLCTCGASCKATVCKSGAMQGKLPPFPLLLRKNLKKFYMSWEQQKSLT